MDCVHWKGVLSKGINTTEAYGEAGGKKMFGLHCDMCGRFVKEENAEGWGRIQTLTTSYGGVEPAGVTKHVCPTCLAILTDKFIEVDG